MLVILSPASVKSDEVQNEYSFALAKKKTVIPLLHKACDVPFRLHRLQYVDFMKGYDRGLESLLKALAPEKGSARDSQTPGVTRRVSLGLIEYEQFLANGAFQVNADALRGEILRPIRQTMKPQAHAVVRSPGGFVSQEASWLRVEGSLSFESARTGASGQLDETSKTIRAYSTVNGLNLFELITADRIVSTISVDFARLSDGLPTLELGGTRVENLRIGGHLVDITLETVFFELVPGRRGSSLWDKDEDDAEAHVCSYLLAMANSAQSFRQISGNIMELRGGDRLILGELSVDQETLSSSMLRYESERMGTISVANCDLRIGTK
jgi:hypothetical protein